METILACSAAIAIWGYIVYTESYENEYRAKAKGQLLCAIGTGLSSFLFGYELGYTFISGMCAIVAIYSLFKSIKLYIISRNQR